MASQVQICNRALQILGATRIVSLADNNVRARACNAAYDACRQAELRAHAWNFSVRRKQLAASADAPLFGPANYFTLPADCLRVLPPDPAFNFNNLDWQIEEAGIATDDSAPLNVRYVGDITDPNKMDALFRECLAARLAWEMCEELTQSNVKKADAKDKYATALREARRINAFEEVAQQPPEDEWITAQQ